MRVPSLLLALALGCGGPGGSAEIFDDAVMHRIDIEVAPEHLGALAPHVEERVPCTFTFDGETLGEVGIRLKGATGSAQELSGKPGFSLKFDQFVEGQKLSGLKRLILNSEIQDESFLSRRVGNAIWSRAGFATTRTSYAVVYVNGERYGVYTVEEAKNKDFLKQHFEDPSGNLYEGAGRDFTDVGGLQLKTNEEANDRSDLRALRDMIEATPDDQLLAALPAHMDVDAYFLYWAIEAILYHWDGYAVTRIEDDCCAPNNYYLYRDPSRGFVFVPHGADQLMKSRESDALEGPDPEATLAFRLFQQPEARARLAAAMRFVLDELWDEEALIDLIDSSSYLVQESYVEGGHEKQPFEQLELYRQGRVRFVKERPGIVRAQLAAQGL